MKKMKVRAFMISDEDYRRAQSRAEDCGLSFAAFVRLLLADEKRRPLLQRQAKLAEPARDGGDDGGPEA